MDTLPAGYAHFKYRTSGSVGDDRQTVTLHFKHPVEFQMALTVSARIRHPMTLFPSELTFGQVALGTKATQTLRIENYIESDWPGIVIGGLPPYIQLSDCPIRWLCH